MLKNIKLTNFRAFSEQIEVRVRPITILIGCNSVGKSTLIKFLLMLQQTLEVSEDAFLVTEGRHVHLGMFAELKNSTSTDKELKFELEIETSDLPPLPLQTMRENLKDIKFTGGADGEEVMAINLETIPRTGKKTRLVNFKISADVTYGKNCNKGSHVVTGNIDEREVFKVESKNLRRTGFLSFPATSDRPEEVFKAFLNDSYLQGLRYEMRSIRHLSPIREESQRGIIIASPPPDDVGHMGEYAMPHLQRLLSEGGNKSEFVRNQIATVLDVEGLTFKPSMKGYISECRARNKSTGADSYLADFGFGVSQCIPIFVQGALLNKRQLLIVEQPEAQIHPTAQLEMGSFFAQLWTERGVPSIIETHSENIILRLRKLIAKGELNPEDVTIAYFKIEDRVVKVNNLDINPDGSIEKGLPMKFFGADVIEALGIHSGE